MIDESELATKIGRLIQAAERSTTDNYARTDLFDRYIGEPYGDEVEGRSQFISSDCSDAVEAMLPDILEPFMSSQRVAEFKPVGPEDEEAAEQETDAIHHFFWTENDGFQILYTWFKEALIQQNAYVESGWVEKKRTTIERYEGLTPEELGQVLYAAEGEIEILKAEGFSEGPDGYQLDPPIGMDEQGQPQFAPISVHFKCEKREKKYEINCFPSEEMFVSPRWTKLTFDGCPVHGRRCEIEAGELVAMGFDRDSVDAATGQEDDTYAEDARHDTRDNWMEDEDVSVDGATRKVVVYRAFVRVDIDDDGIAELVEVWATGDGSTILTRDGKPAIEEVSYSPYSAITPYPVPHRHNGRSVTELVDDIQHVKTVLTRTTLDSVYATLYPRPRIDPNYASKEVYEDLASPKHGAPIRHSEPIEWTMPPSIAPVTLPMIQAFDDAKEMRVGATRYNQGLDADSLNKTASGINQIQEAGKKRLKVIARIFANGLRDVFLRMHRDLRNGGKETIIKLRNTYVPVNPRAWKERTDMYINVGMGTGDRDEKRAAYMMMQQAMQQFLMDPEFRQSGAIGYEQMYNLAKEMGQSFGLLSVDKFMTPPEQLPPPPEPSPEQQQMEQARMAAEAFAMQQPQLEMQMRQQEMERRFALEREKIQLDAQIKLREVELRAEAEATRSAKAAADIQTDQERLELDRQQSLRDDDFKRDKLEADVKTGYYREVSKVVNSQPPTEAGYAR